MSDERLREAVESPLSVAVEHARIWLGEPQHRTHVRARDVRLLVEAAERELARRPATAPAAGFPWPAATPEEIGMATSHISISEGPLDVFEQAQAWREVWRACERFHHGTSPSTPPAPAIGDERRRELLHNMSDLADDAKVRVMRADAYKTFTFWLGDLTAGELRALLSREPARPKPAGPPLEIVFDGPPGPVAGRFVEVEIDGRGVRAGRWEQRGEYWHLILDGMGEAWPKPASEEEIEAECALGLLNPAVQNDADYAAGFDDGWRDAERHHGIAASEEREEKE